VPVVDVQDGERVVGKDTDADMASADAETATTAAIFFIV